MQIISAETSLCPTRSWTVRNAIGAFGFDSISRGFTSTTDEAHVERVRQDLHVVDRDVEFAALHWRSPAISTTASSLTSRFANRSCTDLWSGSEPKG